MAGMLDYAMAWASRGFRVFPLIRGTRDGQLTSSHVNDATTDPNWINYWWGNGQDHNIGVATGNGLTVIDIDVKKGKPGLENFLKLVGEFNTLTVQTPSGGYHCYYTAAIDFGQSEVDKGVDVRSHHGYVLAPGSYVKDVNAGVDGFYQIVREGAPVMLPTQIAQRLRPAGQRKAHSDIALVDLDQPRNVSDALHYLAHQAPIAIEGQNGNDTTYRVAARLTRDFALSDQTAYELLQSYWNPKCAPPWGPHELWALVQHSRDYGQNPVGAATTAVAFGDVAAPPALAMADDGIWQFGNALDAQLIPRRPWVVDRYLMERQVTLVAAEGAAGKSTLMLLTAACLAVNRAFHSRMNVVKPGKSIIINKEDDIEEMSRRLWAICDTMKFDWHEVRKHVNLISIEQLDLTLAMYANGLVANEAHIAELIRRCSGPDVRMLGLDPLVKLHQCDEQDNIHMDFVMTQIMKIARHGTVACLVNHHIPKSASLNADTQTGSMSAVRGAGSIVAAARIAFTMFPMPKEDQNRYSIDPDDIHKYVRLDDAKMNLALKMAEPMYFERTTHSLPNGEGVGALRAMSWAPKETEQANTVGSLIYQLMAGNQRGQVLHSEVRDRFAQFTGRIEPAMQSALDMALHRMYVRGGKKFTYTDELGRMHEFVKTEKKGARGTLYHYKGVEPA
jgi:hypothetical protein